MLFRSIISVRLADQEKPKLYYFITYTVTNRTGEEQLFVPEINILTDAGDLIRANRNLSPAVFKAIKDRVRNPLLESPNQIIGRILQGADNARDGVLIWPVPDHDVDHLSIFFGGLSGETHSIKDPATGEEKLLRKTLQLEYATPGDQPHTPEKPIVFKAKTWIVR